MAESFMFKPILGRLMHDVAGFYHDPLHYEMPENTPIQLPRVPSDEILPVHFFDDTRMNRGMVMSWTLRFDEILNPEKLHLSLAKLVHMGGWRKLGGRLRLNNAGKLEIHVPRPFTKRRPPVHYTHADITQSIDAHDLGRLLPHATSHPSLQPGPMVFRELCVGPRTPASVKEFLLSDNPQLSLHIVSFTDATLVSLSWPHTMTDAFGRKALVQAWCKVLAGNDDEVPSVGGLLVDPIANLGTTKETTCSLESKQSPDTPGEQYVLAERQVQGFKLVVLFFLAVISWLVSPGRVLRTIVLPPHALVTLLREARADLNSDEFISEGDVLTAWTARLAASILPPSSNRSVLIGNAFELRGRLPEIFQVGQRMGEVYLQNLVLSAITVFTASEVRGSSDKDGGLPVGRLARSLRQSISVQTTPAQTRAQARVMRQAIETTGNGPAFGDPTSFVLWYSNWTRGKFFDVIDFGPAVDAVASNTTPGKVSAKPVYYHAQTLREHPTVASVFNILGKDRHGNYWITGYLPPATWRVFETELHRLAMLA